MASMFRGIAFPFSRGTTSVPAQATDADLVRQSIMQILLTARGERVMRPELGTAIYSYIFEPADAGLDAMIRMEVSSAIARFEPRALVQDIAIQRQDSTVTVLITYIVVATQQQQTVALNFQVG